ncbi:MAG: DUF1761 domain-containing protein [Actinomycetota bacterium]|nr:DUF1761 domain-containing protein [Actinomycetota bacterium]
MISIWAVLAAATSTFLLGGAWYGLLNGVWLRHSGVTDDQLKRGNVQVFVGAFLLALVMAASLAAFIGEESTVSGLSAGLAAGVTWVAAAFGVNYLYERRSVVLFALNAGYNVIAFTIMGTIIGAIQ